MPHSTTARDNSLGRFKLSFANQQTAHAVNQKRLLDASRRVLQDSKLTSAAISIAVVDDATIHQLNRRFLDHDYPTDVLSFMLEQHEGHLEGEIVLSADTAALNAAEVGWSVADEQMLYVIHGTLHLVGLLDESEAEIRQMRAAEEYYLRECGVELPDGARVVRDVPNSVHRAGGPGGSTAP